MYYRCVICNAVNTAEIETNPGEYHPRGVKFYQDMKHKESFMCSSCAEEILELKNDYHFMDESNEI